MYMYILKNRQARARLPQIFRASWLPHFRAAHVLALRLQFVACLYFLHDTTSISMIVSSDCQKQDLTRWTHILARLGASFGSCLLTRAGLSHFSCSLQTTRGLGNTEAKQDSTGEGRLVFLFWKQTRLGSKCIRLDGTQVSLASFVPFN